MFPNRPHCRVITGVLATIASMNTWAVERVPLVSGPDLELPSFWRVMVGFVFAAGLAMALVLLLRKIKPWLPSSALTKNADIVAVSQRQLSRNLTVHIIEVENQRFMIVNSAHSTLLTSLNKAPD
jgi:hypothetical protein